MTARAPGPGLSSPPRCRASRGFTLIELLIALTLLGLLTVVLFGGLRFGTRAWEAGSERAEHLGEIEAVRGLLRRQIVQAMPPGRLTRSAEAGEAEAAFSGGEHELRFTSLVPAHIGVGGIYRFRIALTNGGEGRRLELSWRIDRPDEEGFDVEDEPLLGGRRVLLEGIEEGAFRYYGARDQDAVGGDAEWYGDWDSDRGLPELVALDLTFASGDSRAWPELLVAPRLTGASARAR